MVKLMKLLRFFVISVVVIGTTVVSLASNSIETPFVEWNPNGRLLAYWNEKDFYFIDFDTGEIHNLSPSLGVVITDLDWSMQGDKIAIGTLEGEVQIWRVDVLSTDEVVIEKLTVLVHGVTRDPDGVETGVSDVAWSPDGGLIASTSGVGGDSLQIWDAQTYTKRFAAQASSVADVAWNEQGTELAVASVNGLRVLNQSQFLSSTPIIWSNEIWQSQTLDIGRGIPEQRLSNPVWDALNRNIIVTTWFGQMWQINLGDYDIKQLATLDQRQAVGRHHTYLDVVLDPLSSEYISLIRYSYSDSISHEIRTRNAVIPLSNSPRNITLSPYGGRLAYGQVFDANSTGISPFQIIVPAPSLERLAAIAALCVQDSATRSAEVNNLTRQAPAALDDLPAFVTQVEALPDDAIPPACKADLLAVAAALQD